MSLTISEVEHIAELARLSLTAEETARYRTQLSAILDYAAVLQGIDTTAIMPTATGFPLSNVMRADVTTPSLSPAECLANAPEANEGYFKVKTILETGS